MTKKANTILRQDVEKKNAANYKIRIENERSMYRADEYTQKETLEFSKIPLAIPDEDLEDVMLDIINDVILEFGVSDDNYLTRADIHACHRRQGQYSKENVIIKFVWRGHTQEILSKRTKLKDQDLTKIHHALAGHVYVNEFLCPYYRKLRYICENMCKDALIHKTWVSGHKIKVIAMEGGRIKIISHTNDLRVLLPETDLTKYLK